MLPLKELEFRDLLLYMKSDKIKVYKIGGSARFIKSSRCYNSIL